MNRGLLFCLFQALIANAFAQNWAPLPLQNRAYFLRPDTIKEHNMQGWECIATRFDSTRNLGAWVEYTKKRDSLFSNIMHYRAWDFFGNRMSFQAATGKYRFHGLNLGVSNATVDFLPKRMPGDTSIKSPSFYGLAESKFDSVIQGNADSVLVIRLKTGLYEGKTILLSKNLGLLQLPFLSYLSSSRDILLRHFESADRKYDFTKTDKKPWKVGDEVHYVYKNSRTVNGPSGSSFSEMKKVKVKCLDSTANGLVLNSEYEGYTSSTPNGGQTTITNIPYTQTNGGFWVTNIPSSVPDSLVFGPIGEGEAMVENPSGYSTSVWSFIQDNGLFFKFCSLTGLDWGHGLMQTNIPFERGIYAPLSNLIGPVFGGTSAYSTFPVFYKSGTDTIGTPVVFTSVENVKKLQEMRVFPNPGRQTVYFDCGENRISEVVFWNVNGRQSQIFKPENGRKLNIQGMPSGIYFFQAEMQNGEKRKGKMVVE